MRHAPHNSAQNNGRRDGRRGRPDPRRLRQQPVGNPTRWHRRVQGLGGRRLGQLPRERAARQIYAQALQAHGVKVTTKFNIGAREVYYPEIKKGAVTIIPEYNGALLTTSVDPTSTAASTAEVDAALKANLPSTLEILNPSSAQDADSVTVTRRPPRRTT